MLERWKLILSNWNNCYFSDSNKNEPTLDIDSLLNIISHLRENLNLDESKSSILEAHTVKEFIEEKYPGFKFENGTDEPTNEEEVYLVASLLLFFVCVNSKDVDIKNAMCSKLNSEDQKTILKFSKCLMECSEISYSDVKAAIREACGQDIAGSLPMEVSPRPTVAETPPALRSLHSEVRRLQAALDAERFDRNYLQEELNRTNLKVEKLLKEKAQHKLDIVNLKAKISLCGLETESKDADAAADKSAKLARQLQHIEDKLVETQAQLDDSVYERDVYKKKVEDLKRERDKYLSLSQSEATRVSELSEELETERRHVQTLKDLITELRQHNRLNKLDSSLLECDDPDASIHSLPHNSSICSEACANVVEVQLGEERAKIVVLKQQIQSLQDQLSELSTKTECERKTLQNVISDRENNIFNLKHRINEEIEEKNNIKAHYDNEMTKLNNEINELEQRLKNNSEHSRSIIEKKMQEIQTLQEEKLSLLHSLNNETTKLDNIIKDLQNDLESEKQNKSTMRENYEAHIMKLNEKVLNRNNELVELQNSVFEKGEVIETLQIELRKEKEAKEELTKQYQELNKQKILVENDLQQKKSDVNEFQIKLQRNNTIIEDMKSELFGLHKSISELKDKCKILEDAREILVTDVQNRDIRIEDTLKEVEEITSKFNKENEKLKLDLDEKKATIHSLQTQLKNEIQFKVQLQNELDNLNSLLQQATVVKEQLNTDLTKIKTDIQDKDKTIDAIDLYLQEEKKLNAQANERIQKLTDHVVKKEKEIKLLKEEVARINNSLLMEIETNKENVEIANNKLLCEIAEKESLQMQVKSLKEENVQMENVIAMKCEEIMLLRVEIDEHLQKVNERDALIRYVEKKLIDECKKYDQLEAKFEVHMTKIMKRFNEMGKFVVQTTDILRNEVIERESALTALNINLYQLREEVETTNNDLTNVKQEKDDLLDKLREERLCKTMLQEKYDTQCNYVESLKLQFTKEIELLTDAVAEKSEGLTKLEAELILERQNKKKLASEMNSIVKQLKDTVIELESLNSERKNRAIQTLQLENEQLRNTITENKNAIKENTNIIDNLAKQVLDKENKLHDLSVQFENYKSQIKATLQQKNNDTNDLVTKLNEALLTIKELQKRTEEVVEMNRNISLQLTEEKALRDALETEKEQEIKVLLADKESLIVEKTALTQEILDERWHKKIAEDEKNVLLSEKILIKEHLAHDWKRISTLEQEVKELSQQLTNTKVAKEIVEKERDSLALEKTELEEKLQASVEIESELYEEINNLTRLKDELQSLYDIKKAEYDAIQHKHENLTEHLKKERITHNYLLRENQHLTNDNEQLTRNLDKMHSFTEAVTIKRDTAVAEKESLIQSIEIEKSAREDDLNTLRKEIHDLKETLDEYAVNLQTTETKLEEIIIELERKDKALTELIAQTDIFKLEKKNLINALAVEQSSRDTLRDQNELLINKMNQMEAELIELQDKYGVLQKKIHNRTEERNIYKLEIQKLKLKLKRKLKLNRNQTKELKTTKQKLELLKNNCNEIADSHRQIFSAINTAVSMLIQKFKEVRLKDTDEVQKLEEKTNSDPINNLQVMVQVVKLLINEKESEYETLNQNLVTANLELSKLNDLIVQKDAELLDLKAKVTQLEQIVHENINELTKQSENYMTSLNSKVKDILVLQEENKSLQNDLNDVKLQLEVKVHSLKEKLVDNENVTDKLKTTYDTQIDNLNVMVTKLTNYLKEKTIELEALKMDKENLLKTIEDGCKVIKSLEEEIKSEKQNMDKVVAEFESERLVLQNMVTVTESVMEDQKISLNNIIAEHLKDIEVLNKNYDKLKNNINSVEFINDSLRFMLKQEREVKMQVENESEIAREYLDEVINELRDEKRLKTILETEKRELIADIEKRKDDLDAMRKAIGKLKEEKATIANEVDTLLDNMNTITEEKDVLTNKLTNSIAEKTELQSNLEDKTELVKEFQAESKVLKDKLNELTKEKDHLVAKENALINKIEEVKQINEEFIGMLKLENKQLNKTVDKVTNDLQETRTSYEELKQTKLNLENEIVTLKEDLTNSINEKTGLEILLSHKTQQLNNIVIESKEHNDKLNELITEKVKLIEDKNSYIDKLEEVNQANMAKEDEEIAKLKKDREQLAKTVEEKNDAIEKLEQILKNEIESNQKLRDENEQEKHTLINKLTMVQEYQNQAEKHLEERVKEINTLQKELATLKISIQKYEHDAKTKDDLISEITEEKDAIINSLIQELSDKNTKLNTLQQELTDLKDSIEQVNNTKDGLISEITKEKDAIITSLTQELLDEKTKLNTLQKDISYLKTSLEQCEQDNKAKESLISEVTKEKDAILNSLTKELSEEKAEIVTLQQENKMKQDLISEITKEKDTIISEVTKEKDAILNSLTQELSKEKVKFDNLQQENKMKQDLISEITKEKDATITSLTQKLSEEKTIIDTLQQELTTLKGNIEHDNKATDSLISKIAKEKDAIIDSLTSEIAEEKIKIETLQTELFNLKSTLEEYEQENKAKNDLISEINNEKDALTKELSEEKTKIETLQQENKVKDCLISEINKEKDTITIELSEEKSKFDTLQQENKAKDRLISELNKEKDAITKELSEEKIKIDTLQQQNNAKDNLICKINKDKDVITKELSEEKTKIDTLQQKNKAKDDLISEINKQKDVITKEFLEEKTKSNTLQQQNKAKDDLISEINKEKEVITKELSEVKTKIDTLQQENKAKDDLISEINKEKDAIAKELSEEKTKIDTLQQENKAKDGLISKMSKEKDTIINTLTQELSVEKIAREKSEKDANMILNELKNNMEVRRALMKENDQLTQAVGQQETFAAICQEKAGGEKYLCLPERRDFQVSTSSDSHSSIESLKTISDLEKIIHDKNRTITTLQSDITYMKTLMAESENKLLDVNKELEVMKENCQQLSNQLKKIVYQKNEEIAELKKQVNKMSATETRATQIIKVSSKYHAMILKRIAEIKTNTVLKELTNFGNTASDNELRRSLNAGTITMEELENFLDTTDRHLKRCAEKQVALQKERDRLYEVNRINESEIINLKKFLNELSLSFQTFSSVKNLYAQKLSRVISVQRTVRREILNLDGRVTDSAMCRLERGYAAVMQDLAECAMNLERWVERCISRTVSVEKIKQAYTSDSERSSLSSQSFQNTGLEIQLEELEKSFQKLLEEVANVQGDGARDTQATTVMEVRAQYEDKLNRMKAKMKELMTEQMTVLKEKQRAEIGLLERELQKTRDKMEEVKRGYEAHIRELTKELWNYGEKYLVKTDEAEWLKRKQHSGSLMSLQHVHSSGLVQPQELPSRPSDAHSLRSLPIANNTNKREGRGLHMSDEEGEVFDNRFLKEIQATPRRERGGGAGAGGGKRLSELQFRNSLCPPHLKSSYPAETQFVPVLDEEEIKAGSLGPSGKTQRKEVGITAYKKPGPPTPSKQAGRLSATDSELRESLRVEADPHPADRKTSTPARIRAFLSFKTRDTTEGTPRTRRLSYNIFRKK